LSLVIVSTYVYVDTILHVARLGFKMGLPDAYESSSFVVWAALLTNLLVAGTKLAAALVTGSTALFLG
jgi:hypothetical protein